MRTKILSILVVLLFFISPVMAIDYDYDNENHDVDCVSSYSDGIWTTTGYNYYFREYGYSIDGLEYSYKQDNKYDHTSWHDDEGNGASETKRYENTKIIGKTDDCVNTYEYTSNRDYLTEDSREYNDITYIIVYDSTGDVHIYEENKAEYPNGVSETEFNGMDYTHKIINDYDYDHETQDYYGEESEIKEGTWYKGSGSETPNTIIRHEEGETGEIKDTYEYGRENGQYYSYTESTSDLEGYEKTAVTDKSTDESTEEIIEEPTEEPTEEVIEEVIEEVTVVKEEGENCMSSPSMGIGLKLPDGTITKEGDKLPTLYTWAEKDDKWEHHTTLYFPVEGTCTGCVIVTPPQTAGVPIQEKSYWDTAKAQRYLEWKANSQ